MTKDEDTISSLFTGDASSHLVDQTATENGGRESFPLKKCFDGKKESGKKSPDEKQPPWWKRKTYDTYKEKSPDEKQPPWWKRLKTDDTYKEKFLLSLSICWSFLILGWVTGQFGPSFLDLQVITGTEMDKASLFLTSCSIGHLFGSLFCGILFEKCNKILLLVCFMFCGSLIFTVIPWCFWFELMVTMQFLRGFLGGVLTVGVNSLLMSIWGQEGRSFMQALYFSFALGGIISPLVTAPFLLKETVILNKSDLDIYHLDIFNNRSSSFNTSSGTVIMITNDTIAHKPENSSLYIPFSITAALHVAGALPLLVMYLRSRQKKCTDSFKKPDEGTKRITRDLPKGLKVAVFFSICLYILFFCAVEDSFHLFLTTFCVRHMGWTKARGSFATCLFWAAFGGGRFLGIWIVKLASPDKLLFGISIILSSVFAAHLVCSWTMTHAGVWACSVGVGASMSIIFPTVFTFTEEKLVPVSEKVSSLIIISASGAMVNPVLLGFLMDTFSPIWFSYLLFGESLLLIVLYLNLLLVSRLCDRHRRSFYDVL